MTRHAGPTTAGREIDTGASSAAANLLAAATEIAELARDLAPTAGRTRVIAIDGHSGSGKTALAETIANGLGAPLIGLDDLYEGWEGLADVGALLEQWVIAPLSAGCSPRWRAWDWVENRRSDAWRTTPCTAFLIVEGCGAAAPAIADNVGLIVWVEASASTRAARLSARVDWPSYAPYADRWREQEEAVRRRDRTPERADIIVANEVTARVKLNSERARVLALEQKCRSIEPCSN